MSGPGKGWAAGGGGDRKGIQAGGVTHLGCWAVEDHKLHEVGFVEAQGKKKCLEVRACALVAFASGKCREDTTQARNWGETVWSD